MYLIFDTETTGKPRNWIVDFHTPENWPRLVQLAWMRGWARYAADATSFCHIVRPDGFEIPPGATAVHGISQYAALEAGIPLNLAIGAFVRDLLSAEAIVGHNVDFDVNVIGAEMLRLGFAETAERLAVLPRLDTMRSSTELCRLPARSGRGYKWPTLAELHRHLFGHEALGLHDARNDVAVTARCFYELKGRGVFDHKA